MQGKLPKTCGVPVISSDQALSEGKPIIMPIGFDGLPLKRTGSTDLVINLNDVKAFIAHPKMIDLLKNKLQKVE